MSAPAQNILICFHDFPAGGTERIAIRMATYWVEAGRDVTILCGTEAGVQRTSVDPRVKVVALDPPLPRSLLSRRKLGREMGKRLAELKPDLIFLPGNFHIFLANNLRKGYPSAAIALKISNPPVPSGWSKPIGRRIFKHFARGLDGLARMSQSLSPEIITLLPDKNVMVLHDPVFLNKSEAAPRALISPAKINVLWAGRLEPQKDASLALKTIDVARRTHDVHLTLLGDGAERQAVERLITSMGLQEHVTPMGHVPAIDPYLAAADVLLITSHYEGGPAIVAEALAAGVPIVSTDCTPFLRELMTLPEAGIIVPTRTPDDLAEALLQISARPKPDAQKLAGLIAHLDPQACARAYLDWFDQLVSNRAT